MNLSFWEKNTFIKSPDVVIIGSGIVGLFSALNLKKSSPALHVLILERGMLPYGASTRNAGFACFGSPSEILDDLKNNSEDNVFSLLEKRWSGLSILRNTLGDNAIEYESLGGFEIFSKADKDLFENCLSKIEYLNKWLFEITGKKNMYKLADEKAASFGFKNVSHIIENTGEGQLDTGKLMQSLLDACRKTGVTILNGVNVDSYSSDEKGVEIMLSNSYKKTSDNSFSIRARKLLVCTNGFAKNFLPEEDIKPARAQVLITSPIRDLKIKGCFHYMHGYYYFRNVGDRLLFGGGRNKDFDNEFTEEFGLTPIIQQELEKMLKEMILPGSAFSIDMRWSGIMGLGNTKSPIVKETGRNIFCAVRMGGMGIAIGSRIGEDAARLVLESL